MSVFQSGLTSLKSMPILPPLNRPSLNKRPSSMSNSLQSDPTSTQKQASLSPTGITRLLYLSSVQLEDGEAVSGVPIKASLTTSPTDKTWILPPLTDNTEVYKINLRNLNIFHTWPSVKENKVITIFEAASPNVGTSFEIPAGNWNACSLANYMNTLFEAETMMVRMSYDSGRLGFHFTIPIDIVEPTNCLELFGYPTTPVALVLNTTMSQQPVRMSGPTRLHVNSSLPLYTIPPSGRLGTVPVDVGYGEMLSYFDESDADPVLCSEQHLRTIRIHLTDENNEELTAYENISWGVVLALTPEPNPGFVPQ